MYPSIQAKIWGNIGKVSDLIDMVLDSFIKVHQSLLIYIETFYRVKYFEKMSIYRI